MPEIDGALRCFASQNDNHHVWIFPYNGRGLFLLDPSNGWQYTQIVANVTELNKDDCTISGVSHQALVTGTNYWIYTYRDSTGAPAFEFHPAGGQVDGSGFVVKPSDPTRRLIGGCNYVANGIGFGFGAQNNNVGSYFNRFQPNPSSTITGGSATGTWTAVTNMTTRLTLWEWGDSSEPFVHASGSISGSQAGVACYAGISRDGGTPTHKSAHTPAVNDQAGNINVVEPNNANTEGLHTYDLMIRRESFGSGTVYVNPEVQLVAKYRG